MSEFWTSGIVYKYNMVLREVVKITGPEVLDAKGMPYALFHTTSRREAEGSSLSHPTPRDQEFSLLTS